jgi:DNA-binding transcriptional LysR family regulator
MDSAPLVKLPPLDLLRGFVAVGRHLSVTAASAELCVTQSAVSRQVHHLERVLGRKLFTRGHRSLEFTPIGRRLFEVADRSLADLQVIVAAIATSYAPRSVTISASAGVAALWLLPLIPDLQHAHPDIDVRIDINDRVVNVDTENVDIALRYCNDGKAPEGSVQLFDEGVAPVVSPTVKRNAGSAQEAFDRHVLLEFDDATYPWLSWRRMLARLGIERSTRAPLLRLNRYDQVIQAAVSGHGIAIGRFPMLARFVEDGRLAPLLGDFLDRSSGYGVWLVAKQADPGSRAADVQRWLVSRSSASTASQGSERASEPEAAQIQPRRTRIAAASTS